MLRAAESSKSYIFSLMISFLTFALFGGCGGDDKVPYALTSGDQDAGGGGESRHNAHRDGGASGSDSQDGGGGSHGGEDAQVANMTDAGSDASIGLEDAGAIVLPDSAKNPWIAFVRIDDSSFSQLFFVKADGTGLKEFGGNAFSENDPAWSPDGMKLAYSSIDLMDGASLHVIDFGKGTDSVVTDKLASFTRPRWSPDGKTIVVAGAMDAGKSPVLFRVNVGDGTLAQITASPMGDGGHDFAPDGTLYFVRNLDGSAFDIFSIRYTGSPADKAKRITTGSKIIGGLAVHPDGSRVLFSRGKTGASGETTELVEHTIEPAADRVLGADGDEQAAYFSGGDKLVVNRDMTGSSSEIDVTDIDGKLTTHCTTDSHFNTSPAVSSIEASKISLKKF
jgi:Tol biopolymer transport system component